MGSGAGFIIKAVGSLFGCGYSPVAPGTVGSAVTVAAAWGVAASLGADLPEWVFPGVAVLLLVVGIPLGSAAERITGKDPQWFVLDEAAGVLIAVSFHSYLWPGAPVWLVFLSGFVFFRLFDILKPWPVRRLESLDGGSGIMLDDAAAGVLAWLASAVVLWGWGPLHGALTHG